MKLDIPGAVKTAVERTFKPAGLVLASAYFVFSLIATSSSQTLTTEFASQLGAAATSPTPLALPVSTGVAAVVFLGAALLNTLAGVVATRSLVSDVTDRIPREFLTRNIGKVFLNTLAGGIAFSIIVGLGFVLLIIPGLYLLSAFYFWSIFVAVEDVNFVEGLRSSWEITEGLRLEVFLAVLVLLVISAVFSSIPAALSLAGLTLVGEVLSTAMGAIAGVFVLAAIADLYRQLTNQ
jgi:hypothetical protein